MEREESRLLSHGHFDHFILSFLSIRNILFEEKYAPATTSHDGPHPGKCTTHFEPMVDMPSNNYSCIYSTMMLFVKQLTEKHSIDRILIFNRERVLITAILQYWLPCTQYSSGIWLHNVISTRVLITAFLWFLFCWIYVTFRHIHWRNCWNVWKWFRSVALQNKFTQWQDAAFFHSDENDVASSGIPVPMRRQRDRQTCGNARSVRGPGHGTK